MSTPEPDRLEGLLGIDRTDPVQDLACRLVEADTQLLRALVAMRRTKAIREADVALRMGTSVYAVHVLEREGADPKLSTLRRYALAIGALIQHTVTPANAAPSSTEDTPRQPRECTGSEDCAATNHVHGCYADQCANTGTGCDAPERTPRTFPKNSPEPDDHPSVRDAMGDVWTYNHGTGTWVTPDTQPMAWARIAKKFGPLSEVLPDATGGES